ncbi:MurR/RpiR family transcriptional regulator [Stappia indica]|uniref:MurR/RpiR family transcriptional regulator n=1 Tax=Stappia indica TaxID=538381 RepID=UPI001CD1AC1E|nr:MurR/RpiR family transcriptional regulator [Stappia indica]MCA1297346.1 MurR/RpiR family transcriptional regulator [Stappia indica]
MAAEWNGKNGFGQGTIARIEATIDTCPKALSRIASYITREPERSARASMAELAELCGSGEASIVRFCRFLGYKGFRDFKIALASDIAYQQRAQPHAVPEAVARVNAAVLATSAALSNDEITQVARMLIAARCINLFGSGVSGIVAELFAYRFSRLGLVARAFQDGVAAAEVANKPGGRSVFMVISETGLTRHNEGLLRLARKSGAHTIAVSGRRMPQLGALCDTILLATPLSPLPERGETSPAIAKIFICELLAQEIKRLTAPSPDDA